ncbi:Lipoprotein-anchoring transpeptidase ErfK/SrfK [Parasphingorhabdus marina DSM 22363]|uniref:Lipoprotein-anchoring transpeptidase ErfK/SrfK n=1 Tax=Parasphingorhabdus marina DSM 22363 TaxID=1123272 RepID=A0A1N6G8U4_9SPHN|nr:L,D-transpeptidase family protein [Parasphingorhabdus marina]SIO03928.1 Lipoprotein-anchoring transpeptidase ErfK/SrfK [Parasphingorhabdus marina DSM 22363]
MVQKIALRASVAILALAGLALLALLVLGLTRAITSSASAASAESGTEAAATIATKNPVAPVPETASADLPQAVESPKSSPLPLAGSSPFTVKRVLQIDEPFVHGFYKWDDEGVPDGPIIITVDLKAESISVFRGGYEIGAAAILYGADEKPTPTGVFPITQKSKDHVSNLYHTPMPYMLRMTNDGISIHGSDVEYGYATHGCIGVPTPFAELLFQQVKLGDRVIVTDGKMLNVGQTIVAG